MPTPPVRTFPSNVDSQNLNIIQNCGQTGTDIAMVCVAVDNINALCATVSSSPPLHSPMTTLLSELDFLPKLALQKLHTSASTASQFLPIFWNIYRYSRSSLL